MEEQIDFKKIEEKWQSKWEKEKVFEANRDEKKKKYFANFPYPYINSYLHLGHAFSSVRVDIMVRFMRMQGYNALFPQGWHCTGMPVWAAAQRVRENEPKQLAILKNLGFSEKEVPRFGEVKHWIDTFVPAAQIDFARIGNGVDWRRSFITTDLNPYYDKFIKWQFRKLKEKNLVGTGEYPVVWCPKDKIPIGDHDRVEGEGETTQEFFLLKFKFENKKFLIAATLRPETVYGETNFWANPEVDYVEAKINDENWIISEECSVKLENQGKKVKIIKKINGKELIGKYCEAPLIGKKIIILPAKFSDPAIGTGLVTSVPSDAPYDYIALRDLQENEKEMKKYKLNIEEVKKIKPIAIIDSKEWGDMPAVKIVNDMKIKNQEDPKLEKATETIYKAGFYSGKMNAGCGEFAGMSVANAKEKMKEKMKAEGLLESFYELTGKVVCRCLTPCLARIVSDQWFLKYGDAEWKKKAHECLSKMKLYPEVTRSQFKYVLNWLKEWACTHHHGTGTKLPWDEKWVIESLSDSTIYMAYYTIAHLIKDYPIEKIDDKFFDYIFLEKGEGDKKMQAMKKEFEYWYPLDMRSSAKDLVQNHLSFCIFNHVAIFPEKYWPKSFSINGWLLVDGEKMSKSKGNFFTIREILEKYPADVLRANLIYGGEGIDDPNFELNAARGIKQKLEQFFSFATENYKKSSKQKLSKEDEDFLAEYNKYLSEGTKAMDQMLFRTAFVNLFYQMQKTLKEYMNKNKLNQEVLNSFIDMQVRVLSPFCPHIAEELWEKLGNKGFISEAEWPKAKEATKEKTVKEDLNKKFSEYAKQIISKLEAEGKKISKVYLYIMPFEKAQIDEKVISKQLTKEVKIFTVDDSSKYDPENKSKKARPGMPGLFIE
jgi:leucyl-tRNA synthetase